MSSEPPSAGVMAIIVPQGKVLDYVDHTLRNDTPEEYVRQQMEKAIVTEYLYPRSRLRVEFPVKVGSSRKRVDIAIFPEGEEQRQDTIWCICECKARDIPPTHKTEGVDQLKSYLAASLNAIYGMWTNGQDRACLKKVVKGSQHQFDEITDLPVRGDPEVAEKPTLNSLRSAQSDALLFTFRRCHNYIAGNQGLQKPDAFWEFLKLIFCKITDERGADLQFYATTQERASLNGQMKVRDRLARLFAQVKKQYPAIFKENEVIELEPRVLAYIVSQLQTYSLLESEIDVKGKAYEEIVGSNLRGDRGEFFTPRNVCEMAITMLDPSQEDLVLDPACGTGGFLVVAMNHVLRGIEEAERRRWRDPAKPTEAERRELYRKRDAYLAGNLVGMDLNPSLVKACKMNMVLNNDGSGSLFPANSLERPINWPEELRRRKILGRVDVLFTNPPFGSQIPIDDPALLEQFELAHVWDYDEASDSYELRQPLRIQKSQPPEILFIERCVQLIKPGSGRLAIVLPDAILGAPGLGYVRDWILRNTRILASVDLHPDTFQPGNSTQTSLLLLERKSTSQIELERVAGRLQDYEVFMALANHVGHDKRGNTLYVRDPNGNEVVETRTTKQRETRDGVIVLSEVESTEKVVDDTTSVVAERFQIWLREQAQA